MFINENQYLIDFDMHFAKMQCFFLFFFVDAKASQSITYEYRCKFSLKTAKLTTLTGQNEMKDLYVLIYCEHLMDHTNSI